MDIKLHRAEEEPKEEIGYQFLIGYFGREEIEWRIAFYDEDTDMFVFNELAGETLSTGQISPRTIRSTRRTEYERF